jgi:hypothetical protein
VRSPHDAFCSLVPNGSVGGIWAEITVLQTAWVSTVGSWHRSQALESNCIIASRPQHGTDCTTPAGSSSFQCLGKRTCFPHLVAAAIDHYTPISVPSIPL